MNLQIFGGRGGKSGKKQQTKVTTPSGVTYEQFRVMSDDEKANFVLGVINNPDITVPDYLDKSVTSKVMYAMGMNSKPQVVSDSELDKMNGEELYRSVYDGSTISSMEILDQIRYGDYTQLSGKGGSAFGRALYFIERDFSGAAVYAGRNPSAVMMRAKINPNANIVDMGEMLRTVGESTFVQKVYASYSQSQALDHFDDWNALTALVHGIDGWKDDRYAMIINRGALTVSSTSKKIGPETSWHESKNAN